MEQRLRREGGKEEEMDGWMILKRAIGTCLCVSIIIINHFELHVLFLKEMLVHQNYNYVDPVSKQPGKLHH